MPKTDKATALEEPAKEAVEPTESDLSASSEGDLEDVDHTNEPDVVSASPPRPHASIVNQLHIRHEELIAFVDGLEGEIEGDLGELLVLARSHLAKRKGPSE